MIICSSQCFCCSHIYFNPVEYEFYCSLNDCLLHWGFLTRDNEDGFFCPYFILE